MGYRLLGWAVWNLFLRRRLRQLMPSREVTAGVVVVVAVAGLAYAQSRSR